MTFTRAAVGFPSGSRIRTARIPPGPGTVTGTSGATSGAWLSGPGAPSANLASEREPSPGMAPGMTASPGRPAQAAAPTTAASQGRNLLDNANTSANNLHVFRKRDRNRSGLVDAGAGRGPDNRR